MNRSAIFLVVSAAMVVLAIFFLVLGLVIRSDGSTGLLFRLHDICAAVSALCIATAAWRLHSIPTRRGEPVGKMISVVGTASAIGTALCLSLVLVLQASDMLYMLPQGGIGMWLIAISAKWPSGIGRRTRILGVVVGIGLVIVAVSFVAIAAAQGPTLWALSDQQLGDPDPAIETSKLNVLGHEALALGSLLGVPTYPVWALLFCKALTRSRTEF